jgi:hypothetical protein
MGNHRLHRRHPLRWLLGVATGVAVLIGVAVAASSNNDTVALNPASPPAHPVTHSGSPAASPRISVPPNTGLVGDTFTITTTDNQDKPVAYTVKLTKIDMHAMLSMGGTLDQAGDHMVAVRFTITGKTGTATDDALLDAVVIGTTTDTYEASLGSVQNGNAFNAGEWDVSPGQVESGWVPFELPAGASVGSVRWEPNAGMGGTSATWRVG